MRAGAIEAGIRIDGRTTAAAIKGDDPAAARGDHGPRRLLVRRQVEQKKVQADRRWRFREPDRRPPRGRHSGSARAASTTPGTSRRPRSTPGRESSPWASPPAIETGTPRGPDRGDDMIDRAPSPGRTRRARPRRARRRSRRIASSAQRITAGDQSEGEREREAHGCETSSAVSAAESDGSGGRRGNRRRPRRRSNRGPGLFRATHRSAAPRPGCAPAPSPRPRSHLLALLDARVASTTRHQRVNSIPTGCSPGWRASISNQSGPTAAAPTGTAPSTR